MRRLRRDCLPALLGSRRLGGYQRFLERSALPPTKSCGFFLRINPSGLLSGIDPGAVLAKVRRIGDNRVMMPSLTDELHRKRLLASLGGHGRTVKMLKRQQGLADRWSVRWWGWGWHISAVEYYRNMGFSNDVYRKRRYLGYFIRHGRSHHLIGGQEFFASRWSRIKR